MESYLNPQLIYGLTQLFTKHLEFICIHRQQQIISS
jgi:hypothetical protein